MQKHVFYWLALLFIVVTGCQKEVSFELGNTPAKGSLQSDVTGDCLPKTVSGTYSAGKALVPATNTISISVNVLTTGTYIITTDTINGYHFRATGTFTTVGVNTVILRGNGIPFATSVDNFVVSYDGTVCDVQVTVTTPGVGTLAGTPNACAPITVNGGYSPGLALTATNNAVVQVIVTTAGSFNFTTDTVAGIWFNFSGVLPIGAQSVTLQAQGAIPAAATTGNKTFTVKLGVSLCTFVVNVVAQAVYTINCATVMVNGTYIAGTPLVPATNTITLPITVTTAGIYSITASINGMTFTGSGTLALATTSITLAGSGTPITTTGSPFNLSVGTPPCLIPITVTSAPVAVYTVNCGTAVPDGLFEEGTQLNASNTVTIDVNVVSIGTYNLTTTLNNGMTFSSGPRTFTMTGPTTVTLVGSGTPVAQGLFNIQVPGSPACTFPLTVDPPLATYDWQFSVTNAPTTIYRGENDAVSLGSNPPIPGTSFIIQGSNASGSDLFVIALVDLSGTINSGETYSTSATIANAAIFNYDLPSPLTDTYSADPGQTGVTMIFTVTTHIVATKTITGTFSGTAKNSAGQIITITAGTFKGTYP